MDIIFSIIEALIKALVFMGVLPLFGALSVYLERKISALMQNRVGPNRVGPWGTLQPFADVLKLFMKEDIIPTAADRFFHSLAPILSLAIAFVVWAVIPFADYVDIFGRRVYLGIAPHVNIGVLYVLAMTSVGVYGITLAGWSSNNKYSLMGGLRSSAQMISYELSMGLAVIGVIMITGSLSLYDIVQHQQAWHGWMWNIILQPLGFIIFLISAFAETNRAPFDLPEAEPELVGGFNTEYTGMKFGMFFLAEYVNVVTSSTMIVILYLGGWILPFSPSLIGLEQGSIGLAALQLVWFLIKVLSLLCFFIIVRWTVPRFRYDQLMNLGWKILLPLALLNVVLTAFFIIFMK